MQNRARRLVRVIAILAVAAVAGQLVQSRSADQRQGALSKPRDVQPVAAGPGTEDMPHLAMTVSLPALPGMSPAPKGTEPTRADAVQATLPGPEIALPALIVPDLHMPSQASACDRALQLRAGPQATIGLSLSAPCDADQRVVLRHAGLAVTARTNAEGKLTMALPGMAADAVVSVLFADGTQASGTVALPDAATYRRFVVQWQGPDEFQLHAFENGADYGDPGHVWAGAPHLPVSGQPATGGWMMVLGDASVGLPLQAAVYTFPSIPGPAPEIVIEAPVMESTCGREMLGELLTASAGTTTTEDLTLAMPDCSAVGDILVLKNLAPAVKIAATN